MALGSVAQKSAAHACERLFRPKAAAMAETPAMLPAYAAKAIRLISRSPPVSTYVCSMKYSARGCSMIWFRYGVGKKATLPDCAQYTTRGRWYAMASALFGGLSMAVNATTPPIARMIAAKLLSSGRKRHLTVTRGRNRSHTTMATSHAAASGQRVSRWNGLSSSVSTRVTVPTRTAVRRIESRKIQFTGYCVPARFC